MYAFPVGLIVGWFQVFHKGHEYIIRSALDICDTVLIYIILPRKAKRKELFRSLLYQSTKYYF